MIFDKHSIDYQLNLEALREMESLVPMTVSERTAIRSWVKQGHEPESNPWDYTDSDNLPLNFLQAYRIEYGYVSGPWDYWNGPEADALWNEELKTFTQRD